jgi:hypothetical protein
MDAKTLAEKQTRIKEIIATLKSKGVEACEGDEDFTTVISWEPLSKVEKALEDVKNEIVIRPGLGYAGGHIVYLKKG